tara:strand:+ start:37 stop:519 length:483 start_codon:yes stop_codon:yes gene_type:complete
LKKTVLFLCLFLFSVVFFQNHVFAKEQKIYVLPPEKIASYINATKGQRRALVFYASWCPACRKKIPDLMDMERAKAGSIIAVSEDKNRSNFARYIKKFDDVPFKIIISNPDGGSTLLNAVRKFGVKPWNSYPTIVLIDENNRAVKQGYLPSKEIANFLFQ